MMLSGHPQDVCRRSARQRHCFRTVCLRLSPFAGQSLECCGTASSPRGDWTEERDSDAIRDAGHYRLMVPRRFGGLHPPFRWL